MSKDTALALATGTPTPAATPGLQAVETPPAPQPKLDSERFAALAKRETDFVKRQQLMRQEKEAFEREREQFRPIADQYKQYQEMKSKDPVAALKLMGFSETDIINYLAAEGKPEPTVEEKAVMAAEAATEAKLKAYADSKAKEAKEEQDRRDAQVIQSFKSELGGIVQADPSRFEYCAYYGPAAEDLAYEFTLEVVKQSKGTEMITAKEAMEMVEEYYEEQDQAMSSLKKRQPKEAPAVEAKSEPTRTRTVTPGNPNAEQPKPAITKSRGLANGGTNGIASARTRGTETREQKRERLMDALRNGTKI